MTKMENDIAIINQTYKNSIPAQSLVKDLISSVKSLNELLLQVRKQQDTILRTFGLQQVTVTNI
jgi:hypothetical protein